MGNNCCTCKVFPEDNQLTAPQEESPMSSKVQPKTKPRDVDEGKDANVLRKESSLQTDDLSSDTGYPDITESENEINSRKSSFVGLKSDIFNPDYTNAEKAMNKRKSSLVCRSSDIVDPDYTNAEKAMKKKKCSFVGYSSDPDDHDKIDAKEEMNSKESSFLGSSSDTDYPDETDSENKNNSTESSFLGSSSDPDDPDKIVAEEEMNSKDSTFVGRSSVMSDKDWMKTTTKEKVNPSPIKVQSKNCRYYECEEDPPTSEEVSKPSLVGVQSRKDRCIAAILRKLCIPCSETSTVTDVSETVLQKTSGNNEDVCEEDPPTSEEGSKPSLVGVQSRKDRCIAAILRKLGIRCSVTSAATELSETVLQKTSGNNEVSAIQKKMNFGSTKFPEESDIPQKKTLQKVEKSCSTYDDFDDKEEDNNEDDDDPAELEAACMGPPRAAWE